MKKLLILVFAACVALPAMAAGSVHFMASEDISYDDNIYLTKDDEKDSVISSTHVGAEYKAPVPGTGLQMAATGVVGYNAYTEKPSKNNYWDALANIGLSNDMFTIGDKFLYTSDPANNAETERAKRLQNDASIAWKSSQDNMFGLGITLGDIYNYYIDKDWERLNRNRFNAGVQFDYNMSSKTNLFVEYMFSDITYNTNKVNNSNGHMFGLGINGQLAPKVSGTAKATYALRDYEHDIVGADNHNGLFGYYAAVEYKPTSNDIVRLSGERSMEETTFGTAYGYNRYYVDTNVSLYGAHKFMNKWTAALTLAYDNMAYPKAIAAGTDKRKDDYFSVRPEVSYQFKDWLSAGVWYSFTTRRSNMSFAEYDRNRAGIYAKALF